MKADKAIVRDIITQLKREISGNLDATRIFLRKAVSQKGRASHAIAQTVLLEIAKKYGWKYSDQLVEEFDLTKIFGIPKYEDALKKAQIPLTDNEGGTTDDDRRADDPIDREGNSPPIAQESEPREAVS